MPEGDTVRRVASRLHEALAGGVLREADLRAPQPAGIDLTGVSVDEVAPRGKHLLQRLGNGMTVHSHLGMDGSWHLYRPGAPWRGGPAHEVRAVLRTDDWTAVGYRLRRLDLLPTAREAGVVGHLGPDLLGPDWDADLALARLHREPLREVADALRDQRHLAGIGNIYACESLFLCGVDPWTPVGEVADLAGIVGTARRLMLANVTRPSQVTTGDDRRPHWVHGRRRRPCYRCGTLIAARSQGAPARVTYWCPSCQPPGPRTIRPGTSDD